MTSLKRRFCDCWDVNFADSVLKYELTDSVSFYTNTPNELTIKVITEKWTDITKFTKLPQTKFLEMAKLVLNNFFFV